MDDLEIQPTVDGLEKRQLLAQLQATMFGRPATVTVGQYQVLRRLGSGAMGVVYVATDPRLRREVALKVLHPERRRHDAKAGHRRLRKEARALGQVTHDNVIEVYDVGLEDDRVYLAMELVPGVSLAQWLTERERPWAEILGVLVQAGRGLQAAHEAGVLHRDFKPSNVLVGDDGRARVLDFGLAKDIAIDAATSQGDPAMFERAVESARASLAAFERAWGPGHWDTVNAHLTLGIVLSQAGRHLEARSELEFALNEFDRIWGPSDPGVGIAAENLGLVQMDLGDLEAAQSSLQRAVISIESLRGNEYPGLAITLTHLGEVQLQRRLIERARSTYQRALKVSNKAGPGPRAASLDGLGAVEQKRGNEDRAAEYFEAAAEAWTEALGPDAPQVRLARESAAALARR